MCSCRRPPGSTRLVRLAVAGGDADLRERAVAHALIVAGGRLGDEPATERGLDLLDWLVGPDHPARHFTPIGNDGWWPHGGTRSQFDQQPIEATALILAAAGGLRGHRGPPAHQRRRSRPMPGSWATTTAWQVADCRPPEAATTDCPSDGVNAEPGRRVDPHVADGARDASGDPAHAVPWSSRHSSSRRARVQVAARSA